jgi:predicted enzyme related to lactoylglutathione lyase
MIGQLARVILFTSNMAKMTAFYGDVLGLKPKIDPAYEPSEWIEFEAGGCRIALHKAGKGIDTSHHSGDNSPHKIAFYCDDIAAERKRLIALGVQMGPHHKFGELELCDGPDPDGNRFQLSNRK